MCKAICTATAAALLVAGCAATPMGANYVPLVDVQTSQGAQFQHDLSECQSFATQRGDAAAGAVGGAVAGALFGAVLGAIVGVSRNEMAGFGAFTGGLHGAAHNEGTQRDIIRRCLAGRGYSVLD